MEQLPALQVLIPLICAPLCVLLHKSKLAFLIANTASWLSFGIACLLLLQVQDGHIISYHMGGWAPPWGIEYRVDTLTAFMLLIVTGISSLTLPYALTTAGKEVPPSKLYLLYAGWLIVLTGLLGMCITGDAFNVFVFLEISSLASYLIIALNRDRRALVAALQYLLIGTVGASFLLLGIGLLYQATGTLNMTDLASRVPDLGEHKGIKIAFAFIVIGMGIKAAIFPLHGWLLGAYRFAPAPVTAFLAGCATKVSIYILLRFIFTIYGGELAFGDLHLGQFLVPLALAGILIPSLQAIQQTQVKRLLAFSSLSQIGYITLGIALNQSTALTASVLHLFNHAMIKSALFMAMGAVFCQISSHRINKLAGLGRHMPWTFVAFIIAGLSLIGVPLTAGFISKWYLVAGILEAGYWPLAAVVLFGSLLAVVYIWKIVEAAYFEKPIFPNAQEAISDPSASVLIPLYILIAANLWFGIQTEWLVGLAEQIVAQLMGVQV